MAGKSFSKKQWLLLAAAAGLIALFCFAFVAALGVGLSSFTRQDEPEPSVEPVEFGYCGERLNTLCVVSFGRDVFGNTVVNLYVPDNRYPPFHLMIVRLSGESRFECEMNDKVSTSVYCVGPALNLGEGLEIQMRADQNDQLLAKGTFSLTAFLMTTPIPSGPTLEPDMGFKVLMTPLPAIGSSTSTVTPSVTARPTQGTASATPTSSSDITSTPTPTPTATSSSSYPNYP